MCSRKKSGGCVRGKWEGTCWAILRNVLDQIDGSWHDFLDRYPGFFVRGHLCLSFWRRSPTTILKNDHKMSQAELPMTEHVVLQRKRHHLFFFKCMHLVYVLCILCGRSPINQSGICLERFFQPLEANLSFSRSIWQGRIYTAVTFTRNFHQWDFQGAPNNGTPLW